MRLLSPFPNTFRVILQVLPREVEVCLGPLGMNVVLQHRLAEAGGLPEANVAWYRDSVDEAPEMSSNILRDLSGEERAIVVHREQDSLHLEARVVGRPYPLHRV